MFHRFECPRCGAGLVTQSQAASGAYASPSCGNPACHNATMRHLEQSPHPFPPPAPVIFPQPQPVARQPANYTVLHQGVGVTTVGSVAYLVEEDANLLEIRITIHVNAANPFVLRLHSGLIPNRLGNPANWLVNPPHQLAGGGANCWYAFRRTLPVYAHLGVQLSNAAPLPLQIDIAMKLGNHAFGLIHLLAGHHDNARTLASARGTMVDGVLMPNVMNTADTEDDSYRTVMGVQALVAQLFAPGAIQQINLVNDGGVKWLFLGESGGKLALMVVTIVAGIPSVTTIYLTKSRVLDGTIAWKRKGT